MPPYGIDSLLNRNFDAEGFFESPVESIYDPAFGTLNYQTAYGPAPYTGNIPLTSYRLEPGIEYLSGDGTLRNLGFEGESDLPSFGGSGNPRFNQFGKDIDFINAPQDYPAAIPPDFINAPQDYPAAIPPDFINAPQDIYPPNLTSTRGLPTLDLQSLPVNMGVANEDDEEQVDSLTGEKKSNGILDAIMSVVMPGYNILKNMGSGKNYQFTDPKGSFRGGVYRMDGVNYSNPNSFGGEFFDRSTGTNRFDRAKDRFRDSRSKKDLFAASRTGAEFANAKKILDFQNQPGNYQTNFMDRPKSERNFTGQAPKGTTAFDTKSGMGRRGFYKGGIASLYGQNN